MSPSNPAPVGIQAAPLGTAAWQDGAGGGVPDVLKKLEALTGRTDEFAATAQDAARFGPSGGSDVYARSLREIERIYDTAVWKQLCIALPQQAKGSLDTLLRQG